MGAMTLGDGRLRSVFWCALRWTIKSTLLATHMKFLLHSASYIPNEQGSDCRTQASSNRVSSIYPSAFSTTIANVTVP